MTTSNDQEAVIAANAAFYRAVESLDGDLLDAILAHDEPVRVVHPGWPLVSGRADVKASWERIFDNAGVMQFTIVDPEAYVEGELAWVICTERLTSVQGGRVVEGLVATTNLFRRENGEWRIAHHHGSPVM
ncbi:MAG: nuclear transport factor 2 family protein [Chloroflexi bacterium]|nr:nuclear transport factor 2 family protein [Chloroflexota bacterium]